MRREEKEQDCLSCDGRSVLPCRGKEMTRRKEDHVDGADIAVSRCACVHVHRARAEDLLADWELAKAGKKPIWVQPLI